MPKTLLRNVAITALACVVLFSACQPRQPQRAESSGLTELNGESVTEGTETSEVVSTTDNSAPAASEITTTTEAPAAASLAAAETTSTVVETTTTPTLPATPSEEEVVTTSSVAETSSTVASTTSTTPQSTSTVVATTTTAPESTTTTLPVVASTTSAPMSSSYYLIEISGFSFAPSALTVQVGDTVTWTNLDSAIHTVTFNDSPSLSSSGLQEGDTHSVTFDNVGTYDYGCSPHPSMQGTITVTN